MLAPALCLAAALAGAPPQPIPGGERHAFESRILGETRTVLVGLPESHAYGSQRYPVLVVLDGEEHFQHAFATSRFLAAIGRAPEVIVVGIVQVDRVSELSPPTDVPEDLADGTGGDALLDFVLSELMPWLEASHRAAPLRVLFGHSRGGLINLHALLTRPEAFHGHIAASPYFGWSRERMISRAQAELGRVRGEHVLYLTAGDHEPEIGASVEKLADILARSAPPGLRWSFDHLPGEDHGSTPLPTIHRGLGKVFEGWQPQAAIAAGDVGAFESHYRALSQAHGYEVLPAPVAIWELQATLLEAGRGPQAIASFERAIQLYPDNRYLRDQLVEARAQAGRK